MAEDRWAQLRQWRTRCLCIALFGVLFVMRDAILPRGPSRYQSCHDDSPILIGTHHKTGTVLLRHIMLTVCPLLQWRCSTTHRT